MAPDLGSEACDRRTAMQAPKSAGARVDFLTYWSLSFSWSLSLHTGQLIEAPRSSQNMPLLPLLRLHCRLRDVASDSRRSGRDQSSTWRITRSTKQRSYISTLLPGWTNMFGDLVAYTVSTPSQPDFWQIGALSTECRPASLCSGP